jgi:hypothetical protein
MEIYHRNYYFLKKIKIHFFQLNCNINCIHIKYEFINEYIFKIHIPSKPNQNENHQIHTYNFDNKIKNNNSQKSQPIPIIIRI